MKNVFLFFLGLILPVLFFPTVVFSFITTTSSSMDVTVSVADCVVNSVCETALGEDYVTCLADCPFGCNNNDICETHFGEENSNCVNDCPICNSNSVCEAGIGENTTTCLADCPLPVCNNNGTCDVGSGETTSNCSNDCVVVVPPAIGGGGIITSIPAIKIRDLSISQVNTTTIKFSWNTDTLAVCDLYWGVDKNDLVKNSEISFSVAHHFMIDQLLAGVNYYGQIRCFNTKQLESVLDNILFSLSSSAETSEINFGIKELRSIPEDSAVNFFWKPVDISNYQGVVIRRSDIFFPSNMDEGGVLYDGRGELTPDGRYFYRDINLKNGQLYFYTFFAFDGLGGYLPGLSISVLPKSADMLKPILELPVAPVVLAPELGLPLLPEPLSIIPRFRDFVFSQKNRPLSFSDNIIEVLPNVAVEVNLDIKKVPVGTQNIVFTIEEKGIYDTYFMEKSDNGDFFVKYITSPTTASQRAYFTFINRDNQAIARVSGRLFVNEKAIFETITATVVSPKTTIKTVYETASKISLDIVQYWYYWIWWILILIFFWVKHWIKRL